MRFRENISSGIVIWAVIACITAQDDVKIPKWTSKTRQLMALAANSTLQAAFRQFVTKYGTNNLNINHAFPCAAIANTAPATSVHRLSPADVKVVAAIGDSLTAGTGVKAATIIGLLTEWRGLSWSGGGDGDVESAPTLPNFIKKYNPEVRGYSLKTGSYESSNAHLNVADPGAKASQVPGQAELLVSRLKREPGVNFENDWKVITIFIGGNDLCDYCEDKSLYSAENYVSHVKTALDTLVDNVPRAFVNLVQVLTVPIVEELNKGLICYALHLFTCQCGAFPKNDAARQEIIDVGLAYRKAVEDLILSGRYERDDFTVVIQPFMEKTVPPRDPDDPDEPDLSYFAPDCFHFSEKGQAAAAEGLWNNMLEPEGQKRKAWTPNEPVICPNSATPFFSTRQNSEFLKSQWRASSSQGKLHGDDDMEDPGSDKRMNATPIVLGCLVAVVTVGVGLGIALSIRKRHQRRHPESVGILLHSMSRVVYN